MQWKIILTLFLCASLSKAEETETNVNEQPAEARLLASKMMLSNYAVEGMDMVIAYNIYNVGLQSALKVSLDELNFHEQHFEVVGGQLSVKWDRIAPQANVSHHVVLRPKNFGYFNFTAVDVTYLNSEDATVPRHCYSTQHGESYIYRRIDFDRRFSARHYDWLIFIALAMPFTGVPFMMWRKSAKKYESLARETRKKD